MPVYTSIHVLMVPYFPKITQIPHQKNTISSFKTYSPVSPTLEGLLQLSRNNRSLPPCHTSLPFACLFHWLSVTPYLLISDGRRRPACYQWVPCGQCLLDDTGNLCFPGASHWASTSGEVWQTKLSNSMLSNCTYFLFSFIRSSLRSMYYYHSCLLSEETKALRDIVAAKDHTVEPGFEQRPAHFSTTRLTQLSSQT